MKPLPEHGGLFTIEEFATAVKCGSFIHYDGYGNYATATQMSDESFSPSTFSVKPEYTHVVWFNR